jgi:hypothetical protein
VVEVAVAAQARIQMTKEELELLVAQVAVRLQAICRIVLQVAQALLIKVTPVERATTIKRVAAAEERAQLDLLALQALMVV